MNEAAAQFLAEMGEDAPTEAEIEEFYATLADDHPLQALTGDARVAVASDGLYATRIDAVEVTDVETLRESYEASPASLGVYCATAVVVADRDDAEDVAEALDAEGASWDAVSAIAGADAVRLGVHAAQHRRRSGLARRARCRRAGRRHRPGEHRRRIRRAGHR